MRALVQSAFGPASDVLSLTEIEPPKADPATVLVRVKAAGIAKAVWLITNGLPYIARPSYGVRTPKHRVAGLGFSGTVESLGQGVESFKLGDAVFGFHPGALAEFVAAPPSALAHKPVEVGFEQAAAVPVSGVAALHAVRDGGRVRSGNRVLVIGASGGVGSFAVQIAKAFGAEVTGVASTRNLEMVRGLGADHVVDYTREEPTARRRHYDVVIDIAGNRRVARLLDTLVPRGTLVIVGGSGSRWTMGFERTIGAMLLAPFVPQRIVGLISEPSRRDLEVLAELMTSGKLKPVVRPLHSLSRAPEAIDAVGKGRANGTLVVTI